MTDLIEVNEGKAFFDPAKVVSLESYSKLESIDNKWNGRGNTYRDCVKVFLTGGHFVEVFDTSLAALSARIKKCHLTPSDRSEVEMLRAAVKRLRDGYADAVSGLHYIKQNHGILPGVGWGRVDDHYHDWVLMPEREGLLAGSHDLPLNKDTTNG